MRFLGYALAAWACAAWAQEHALERRLPAAVRVAAETPFPPGCDGTQNGKHYRSAAAEAWVAVDPRNPLRMAAMWQQDRWSNGGASGLVAAISLDGGETWQQSLPAFSNCAGGDPRYARASDPWVSIAPDGTAHAIALSISATQDVQAVLVSRSADGLNWSAPVKLIEDLSRDVFDDKESLTADPTDASYVYAVWDRLTGLTAPSASGYRGPAYFARSTDGGATWAPAHSIFDPGANAQTLGNQILVLPDGTLLNAFNWIQNATQPLVKDERMQIAVIRSTDKGVTWPAPTVVASMQGVGVSDVKTGVPVRTGTVVPQFAVDSITGALYAVWQDGRFSGGKRDGIAFSRSEDGGFTWSAPEQVNRAPEVQAFVPVVAARGGEVAVTYYDFRKDTDDPKVLMTSYWRILSTDGGRSWTEAPLAEPFDLTAAAMTDSGYFLGDYEGLAAAGGRFLSLFVASAQGPVPAAVFATYRPTGGDTLHNGRTEVNRYLLRREIERRTERRRVVRNNP
jgi:hypothetical protein